MGKDEGPKKIGQPKPVKIILDDINGVSHEFEFGAMTSKMQDEIKAIGDDEEMSSINQLHGQCKILLHEPEFDFDIFDIRVIKQCIEYITEKIKNPQ